MNVKPKPDVYISPADGTVCTLDKAAKTLTDASGNTFDLDTVTGTRKLDKTEKELREYSV